MDKTFPEFLLVPYRPISGKMAKDLRNTFIFTMDTIQVTETAYKEHHPEIFSTPFITIRYDFEFHNLIHITYTQFKRWSLSLFEYCQNSVS